MRIIKRGVPPEQNSYFVTCQHCGSELEVEHSETRPSSDQRDVGILMVNCPVCRKGIWFSEKKARGDQIDREASALGARMAY